MLYSTWTSYGAICVYRICMSLKMLVSLASSTRDHLFLLTVSSQLPIIFIFSLSLFEEERLSMCEKCLQNCYGADLQRLALLKTEGVNKHTPIFVRLNVLKVSLINFNKLK